MVAGGLTLLMSDANNDADDIVMITVRSILIDYSQSGLSNGEVGIIKRNQINKYSPIVNDILWFIDIRYIQ